MATSAMEHLIEIANDVPQSATQEFERGFEVIPRYPSANEIAVAGDPRLAIERAWRAEIKQRMISWGLAAKEYVCEIADAAQMDMRYEEVIGFRELLDSIAAHNWRDEGKGGAIFNFPDSNALLRSLELTMDHQTKRGQIRAKGLLSVFLKDAELDRIKRCAYEKCARLFWASRIDRPCCQESCRNRYKQKRHRERERENHHHKKVMEWRKTNG